MTMNEFPYVEALPASPVLSTAQSLSDIARTVARVLGRRLDAEVMDAVYARSQCEVTHWGLDNVVVGGRLVVSIPGHEPLMSEVILSEDAALRVARVAATQLWVAGLSEEERLALMDEGLGLME